MSKSPKKFDTSPYVRRIEKPWGWEIHWTSDDKPYMGKILHLNKGARCSLQKHDQKLESWFLMSGKAKIVWDREEDGELVETEMQDGQGYSCQVGQKHRLLGITDCDIVEVSTPEIGTTFRLEDDYKRNDETPEEREKRNRGAK